MGKICGVKETILFILKIVFKIFLEVIVMEDADVKGRSMSGGPTEFRETEGPFGGEGRKRECYGQCMDDAWDLKGESICSTVCGM